MKGRDLSTPVRVALLSIPICVGTLAVFVYRRLHSGEWSFDEPVAVILISMFLLSPGLVFLFALVRNALLFVVGLLLLSGSDVLGIALAAADSGDGQAGLNLFVTPVLAFIAAVLLGALDSRWRARASDSGIPKGVRTP